MHLPPHWQSLRRKLPLLISTLLVAVVVIVSALAYRQLETTLVAAGRERAANGSRRVADLLTGTAWGRRVQVQRLAADSSVERLVAGARGARASVLQLFERERSDNDQIAAITVWNADREQVLAVGNAALSRVTFPTLDDVPHDSAAGGSWVGPLAATGDTIFFDAVAPVVGSARDTLGFVVVSRLLGSASAATLLQGLIGPDATLLAGNASGGVWTDLVRPVTVSRTPPPAGTTAQLEAPDGEARLAATATVSPTPWLVWVEIPRSAVLAPARHFLFRMGGVALLIILAGTLGAWLLSSQITTPLAEVTQAAEDFATGDYTRRVALERDDELGRLAVAFNTMAQQVADATEALEARVAERTREWRRALEGLQQAQDELVKRERLAILGQLAGGVGHELRNPLGVMTNALYYLDAVLTDVSPEVRDYLGILRTQIGLSEQIVTDLLDFARVKSPERSEVSLEELVTEQLKRADVPANIHIETMFSPQLPPVCIDRMQMGQVVLNLITNAVQAMVGTRAPADVAGNLVLRAQVVDDQQMELQVRDSGPGVAPEHLEKIFEPLFTTKARGIGLGLAVSRTLARANGGDITVSSRPGSGACFSLTLPVTQKVHA